VSWQNCIGWTTPEMYYAWTRDSIVCEREHVCAHSFLLGRVSGSGEDPYFK